MSTTRYRIYPDREIVHQDEIVSDERFDDFRDVEIDDELEHYLLTLNNPE